MYDSRSDHPRKGVHALRAAVRKEDNPFRGHPTRSQALERVITPQRVIREQLAAVLDEDMVLGRRTAPTAECMDSLADYYPDNYSSSTSGTSAQMSHYDYFCGHHLLGREVDEHLRICPDCAHEYAMRGGSPLDPPVDDEESLPVTITSDPSLIDFPWTIVRGDAPPAYVPSIKGPGMRVYELAHELNMTSPDLRAVLFGMGEYTRSASSWLALPACDRVRERLAPVTHPTLLDA